MNASADLNLKKYAWQFGSSDFKQAIEQVLIQAKPVDYEHITCPALFLMGEGEGEELKRQARFLSDALSKRGVDATLHEFTAKDGADAHCQVNNLRLAHLVIFDWLDRVFWAKKTEQSVLG